LRDRVIEVASADERVVAGALVGSLALDGWDRWSDLDLTFAAAEGVPAAQVLDELSSRVIAEFSAIRLFDLRSGSTIYRVFLLPGCLQFDLSVTPASSFTLVGPNVRPLFGEANHREASAPPPPDADFGYAVHHAVRARFCIERGRFWQAEYWISATRDLALAIACRRYELPIRYGRGFDQLPPEVLNAAADSLVPSPGRDALLHALKAAVELLLAQSDQVRDMAGDVAPQLRLLTQDWAAELDDS